VDAVIIAADQMNKELFYFAASRGREEVTVVTSDKELLCDSLSRSGSRTSATELLLKAQASSTPKPPRGIRLQFAVEQGRKEQMEQQQSPDRALQERFVSQHQMNQGQSAAAPAQQQLPNQQPQQQIANSPGFGIGMG